ncbi:MAG: glycoside hydrolase family 43 protein [Spirochaetales bacterium]|nr:glycoside hydrolase family 43 protein [Spirochaetales bacterium]
MQCQANNDGFVTIADASDIKTFNAAGGSKLTGTPTPESTTHYIPTPKPKTGQISKDGERTFFNPVLPGFYPDPSICRAGEDYYLVTSSFSYYPGLPLFHSKDLINWEQIGHALDRPSQLNLDSLGVSQGLYAPAIHYHKKVFYITNTLIGRGGNFIITATDPKGPWSDPLWIPNAQGIDPSLLFDDDGKVYWIGNGDPQSSRYDGHKVIWMQEFDPEKMDLVPGTFSILVDAGSNPDRNPIWIEGPHMYKVKGYYYLMAAEGGTAENHSEVIFRSNNVRGPFESFEGNPILTQRHLPADRKNAITCTGHAGLIETQNGEWWSVFLGCRPYEPSQMNYYNTGRETFMAPVHWIDGWPIINPEYEEVQYMYKAPNLTEYRLKDAIPSGNFTLREEFDTPTLPHYWIFLRTPREKWYSLTEQKGSLRIALRPSMITEKCNPCFIGRRQQHLSFTADTAMVFHPRNDNETAGIMVFQNEKHFYFMGLTLLAGKETLFLQQSTDNVYHSEEEFFKNRTIVTQTEIDKKALQKSLFLRIKAEGKSLGFYYSYDQTTWNILKEDVNNTNLSTKIAGGFVGVVIGLYASSQGKPSSNFADFDWFEYSGNDPLY